MSTQAPTFLRRALAADAAISGATGLLMFLAAAPLERLLGLPDSLLRYAGLSLVPFTLLVSYLAKQDPPPRAGVGTVIALNAAWVVGSVLLLLGGWVEPNRLGQAFIAVQALAVAVFADVQYLALRRTARA